MGARRLRLNVQGLGRRSPELMRNILPPEGHCTASIDLASGEPTVVSHYSKDPLYRYACFDGVGKKPFYKNGVLMISDIYLMTMSVSPIGAQKMRQTFDSYRYPQKPKQLSFRPSASDELPTEPNYTVLSFAEQWLVDSDIAKGPIKKERDIHKMLKLAIDYGIGPKKMVKQCYERGYQLPLDVARRFHQNTWDTFEGVRQFRDYCSLKVKRDGYLVNAFGYRLVPSQFKAFNFFIQSSVSGIMHVLVQKLFWLAPYAKLVTIIHDELIVDLPIDKQEVFRQHLKEATESLNDDLNWSVKVRTGLVFGMNWYEAK